MKLHFHPISAYSQKTLIALYEKDVPFEKSVLDMLDPAARVEYRKLSPHGKIPLLVLDNGWKVPESTIIIEYLATHFRDGTRLIPEDGDLARQVRFYDRFFDLYVTDAMVPLFRAQLAPQPEATLEKSRATLDVSYAMLDRHFEKRTWAVGEAFSMADCAAAPALTYLRDLHPYTAHKNLVSYAGRLLERPSFTRVLKEAAPVLEAFRAMIAAKNAEASR